MKCNENKVMRCIWSAFSLVVVFAILLGFGYDMWKDNAFASRAKKHMPEKRLSYEEFIVKEAGGGRNRK